MKHLSNFQTNKQSALLICSRKQKKKRGMQKHYSHVTKKGGTLYPNTVKQIPFVLKVDIEKTHSFFKAVLSRQ